MTLPGHSPFFPFSRPGRWGRGWARHDALVRARDPLTYGTRKQPHVRFSLPGNVSEAQQRTIRKLAEALGVDPAEFVGD